MAARYPTPQDVGIKIPNRLIEKRFCSGFQHALQGKQITRTEHLRLSFREGYRAGKLYIREQRNTQGVLTFPFKAQVRMRAAY